MEVGSFAPCSCWLTSGQLALAPALAVIPPTAGASSTSIACSRGWRRRATIGGAPFLARGADRASRAAPRKVEKNPYLHSLIKCWSIQDQFVPFVRSSVVQSVSGPTPVSCQVVRQRAPPALPAVPLTEWLNFSSAVVVPRRFAVQRRTAGPDRRLCRARDVGTAKRRRCGRRQACLTRPHNRAARRSPIRRSRGRLRCRAPSNHSRQRQA
jgi:hypothetical protein